MKLRAGLRQVPPGRRLPRRRVQARGDDGGEPARGRAQQHARHPRRRGRRRRVRREAIRARLDGQGRQPEDRHGPVEGARRVDRRDVGPSRRRDDAVRGGSLRKRPRLVRLGRADLPPADRPRGACDGDAPRDDAVLHDDPRGGAVDRPGRRDRRPRAGVRPRHGRAGSHRRPRGEDDPPVGQGAGTGDRRSSTSGRRPARSSTRSSSGTARP